MAKKIKLSRKEIKKDDEFITFMRDILDRIMLYGREILIGLGVIAAMILIYFGVKFYFSTVEKKAQVELSKAQDVLMAPVVPAEQLKAQPAIRKMYPNVATSEAEKDQKALESFDKLAAKYSSTPQGILARYYKAIILTRLGKYDEAITAYDDYLSKAADAPLAPLAWNGKGICLETLGKLDEAAEAFKKTASYEKNAADQKTGYMNLARVQEAKKDYKGAVESLSAYQKLAGESPEKADIERQIDALKKMAGS